MKYCSQCGHILSDDAKFCNGCGATQDESGVAVQSADTFAPKFHCPKCKSTRLTPLVETEVQGGTAIHGAASKHVGASAMNFKNIHRNYWMCQTCGHKFRNLENLIEELTVQQKGLRSATIFVLICAVWLVISFFTGGWFLPLLLTLILLPIYLFTRNNTKKLEKEKAFLEENCLS